MIALGERLDALAVSGAAMVLSSFYIAWREAILAGRRRSNARPLGRAVHAGLAPAASPLAGEEALAAANSP